MTESPAREVRRISRPSTVKRSPAVVVRTGVSLVRRAVPRWATPEVDLGGVLVRADLATAYGLYLYRKGFPEPEARLLRGLLRPGDVFIDGGAHSGTFTLIAAAIVGPEGRVLACEPAAGTVQLLRRNVELNALRNVDIFPVAIAERAGTLPSVSFAPDSALGSQVHSIIGPCCLITGSP